MKQIEKKEKQEIGIHRQQEIQKGLKYQGSTRMHRGHTMYEYNLLTGEINEADIESQTVVTPEGSKTKRKIITKENCQYLPALNKKSLTRKLRKFGFFVKP